MTCNKDVNKCIVRQSTQSLWLTLHMAIISFSFRGKKSTHNTQAFFQTLKSELKFPWETQPHHLVLHASTRHVDWPKSSPASNFLFCHLFKKIYFPHVRNCADSHSVCHANKGSSTAGCACVNTNVTIQINELIQNMKCHVASSQIHYRYPHTGRNAHPGEYISICSGIYYFVTQ